MSDVVERAKAALEALGDRGPWTIDSEDGEPIIHEAHHYDSMDEWYDVNGANGGWVAHCEDLPVAEFIASARSLVPELIAEVEKWRAAAVYAHDDNGALQAMKAERDHLAEIVERVGEVVDSYKLIEDVQILAIINPNGGRDEG
ncbi:hypothetical protein BI081_gp021 [Mycobacterium phage Tonenili]|uniref:Uncharacterized protein n=1 Tax=Mycobacterium phage Tonenili TaxID=1891703 RepID=A0A1C9EGZ9_9CAUD|nr:hypothetical protein BI081_gp021 [Mycobacterium phage Tonenili]AON96772.1 hypothetical protein SEA_TONENILI_21 [Mycobacterium phage Tonenili]